MIEKLDDGDYLIYTDACTLFMNPTYLLINFLKENKFSTWMNRLIHKESVYTKRFYWEQIFYFIVRLINIKQQYKYIKNHHIQ